MVAPAQHYFIRSRARERGPFTLSQLSLMWTAGHITADAFYRLSNVDQWSPISQLVETIEALAPPISDSSSKATPAGAIAPTKPSISESNSVTLNGAHSFPADLPQQVSKHLAMLQTASEVDPSGETERKVLEHFTTATGIPLPSTRCWFSDLPATSAHAMRRRVYRQLELGETFLPTKAWEEKWVKIPRSAKAARLHFWQKAVLFIAMIVTPIATVVLGWDSKAFAWWFRLGCGFAVGYLLYKICYPHDNPGWKNSDAWREHPNAEVFLSSGWSDRKP